MSDYTLLTGDDVPRANRLNLGLGTTGSRIEWLPDFFHNWSPTAEGEALLAMAMAVHTIDKIEARSDTEDAWSRSLGLEVPTRSTHFAASEFERALSFLSGDTWSLRQRTSTSPSFTLPSAGPLVPVEVDAVSLFSGGLDSLCGVIDLLELNPSLRLGLIAYYDGGKGTSRQIEIHERLASTYGQDRVQLYRFWARPAPSNLGGVFEPVENTTRTRSFLFISAALALAAAMGDSVPVYVPENGYIALNVPLTRARVGSLSTRTTHPHYLGMVQAAARASGISNPIVNPYRHRTKGEMLMGSANQALLRDLTPKSISCSHPEVGRWTELEQGNCGYCFPCIIRQASIHAAGFQRETYSHDVLGDDQLFGNTDQATGADLRAVVNAVFAERPDRDLLKNGPVPLERAEHLGVWRRGNAEIRNWLVEGARGDLAELVAIRTR